MASRLINSSLRSAASLARPRRNFRDVGLTAQRTLTNISIGVPSNVGEGEKRVALVPDDVAKLIKLGASVTYVYDDIGLYIFQTIQNQLPVYELL